MPDLQTPGSRSPEPLRVGRRNLWATSLASFFTDISSEMIVHLLPLYLAGVLGVKTAWIGLIEGLASTVASLVQVVSGRLSDRWRSRKWLAVAGYGLSTAVKPFFALVSTWGGIAVVRWLERVGKGVRTAPRDALLADSAAASRRGLVFGLHRAADTLGALLGLAVAAALVWHLQGTGTELSGETFKRLVWWSLVPAVLGVVALAVLARDVKPASAPSETEDSKKEPPEKLMSWRLGRPFALFLGIVALFELGNSADAFLILRAVERGTSVVAVLGMLLLFNLVYALLSTPGGWLSDRFGRRKLLAAGWVLYAAVYSGFAFVDTGAALWPLFALYGAYYGLTQGAAKALVADLVPTERRGTAYGALNATLAVLDLPASLLAGILWQGLAGWSGFGPAAPFLFGASLALLAAVLLLASDRRPSPLPFPSPSPERDGE